MYILSILFFIFCSLKSLYYGYYELTENKNKSGGIAIFIIAILGFILSVYLIGK